MTSSHTPGRHGILRGRGLYNHRTRVTGHSEASAPQCEPEDHPVHTLMRKQ